MISFLLYLSTHTRPDITFVMCSLTYYLTNFSLEYIKAAKYIFRYFQEIIFIRIIYGGGTKKSKKI
jgi:hypothetical protein